VPVDKSEGVKGTGIRHTSEDFRENPLTPLATEIKKQCGLTSLVTV
jgi:hypothetical protein